VLVGSRDLELWAMSEKRLLSVGEDIVPVAPPEYVILSKLEYHAASGSTRHPEDIVRMLQVSGSQLVTNCHRFKLPADDGKMRLTDVADAETLLRLVQSVPSPKAEPIKLWLAKVGYERMQEMADPARALERARVTWQKQGRPVGAGSQDRQESGDG